MTSLATFSIAEWSAYLALGLFAGFVAGLLGVGGGLVIVPVLIFIFTAHHFPAQYIVHLALGTSLASIIFTSISSFRAHHTHDAVNWKIWREVTPGIVTGTLLGSVLAAYLSAYSLKVFFAAFGIFTCLPPALPLSDAARFLAFASTCGKSFSPYRSSTGILIPA